MTKTVVLDDDPTGTQSASGVTVLLTWDADTIAQVLRDHDAVYLQTNSRAISEADAVALCRRVAGEIAQVATELAEHVDVVLRGDSTLRGHVFAETDVFVGDDSPILFLPAFPAGGRTTRDGVHYVGTAAGDVPAHETEYARDPVFPFRSSDMVAYVRELGGREAVSVPLDVLRAGGGSAVAEALLSAPGRSVVAPDAVTDEDIDLVHAGLSRARSAGRRVVVRCAAPLAARCAGAVSAGLLPAPVSRPAGPVLVVCGSHTDGATAQLARLTAATGVVPHAIDTDAALLDPRRAGRAVVDRVRADLTTRGLAIVSSSRSRRPADNTLSHGERVMTALTTAVDALADDAAVVVAKGGITSAEVARTGLGAHAARVRGQILPGVSVWDLTTRRGDRVYVVVPGNVGGPATLADIARLLGA
ncbi:four-carbon acid sugar kinase family protein [Streptomyces sp. TP-A0875]|uniref:four-carbon acid sugar kinase family protein n=1 Tax=Streptomyces sp. TP-A0875 TaxID=552354 RepID=UPI0006B5520F|nr:four-carbon acid sugar kinase family protein [Streptomyces sp. TP-A0875]